MARPAAEEAPGHRVEPRPPEDEPLPTRTMARLLRAQGHYRRALAIYDGLVQARPLDVELAAEAEATRAEAREARPGGSPGARGGETSDDDAAGRAGR